MNVATLLIWSALRSMRLGYVPKLAMLRYHVAINALPSVTLVRKVPNILASQYVAQNLHASIRAIPGE